MDKKRPSPKKCFVDTKHSLALRGGLPDGAAWRGWGIRLLFTILKGAGNAKLGSSADKPAYRPRRTHSALPAAPPDRAPCSSFCAKGTFRIAASAPISRPSDGISSRRTGAVAGSSLPSTRCGAAPNPCPTIANTPGARSPTRLLPRNVLSSAHRRSSDATRNAGFSHRGLTFQQLKGVKFKRVKRKGGWRC